MPRLGLWGARSDRRGLHIQSSEFAKHMRPDKVVGFSTRSVGWSKLKPDWRDFEAPDIRDPNRAEPAFAKEWAADLDVIWGCETFYHDDFPDWVMPTATIQHVNPEFYRFGQEPSLPRPTIEIAPTNWRIDRMPGVRVLPCPVNRERCHFIQRPLNDEGPITFLHVVGLRAMEDRNGTLTLIDALKHTTVPSRLIIRSQANVPINEGKHGACQVILDVRDQENYWQLYDGADVLVMPRRYGGQSLPMLEAMSCGLPVIATDLSPQNEWLPKGLLVPAELQKTVTETQCGPLDIYGANPKRLAVTMDHVAANPAIVEIYSGMADVYAETMSWQSLKPQYDAIIAEAAGDEIVELFGAASASVDVKTDF